MLQSHFHYRFEVTFSSSGVMLEIRPGAEYSAVQFQKNSAGIFSCGGAPGIVSEDRVATEKVAACAAGPAG